MQERRSWLKRLGAALGLGLVAGPALAGTRGTQRTNGEEPFLGEIMLFAGTFAPRGYALCNGQLLSITQNTALFSLLGTTYGGDGRTTFALPDLRGRFPLGAGQGPGNLSPYNLGQPGGSETITLSTAQLPAHTHSVGGIPATTAAATSSSPAGNVLAVANGRTTTSEENLTLNTYAPAGTSPATTLGSGGTTGSTGNGQPISNLSPYLALNFCIAVQGIYPSRD
jgi:microcystin-dependent protein